MPRRDAGNEYVGETESFSQTPGARCNEERLATLESEVTRALNRGSRHRHDTETTQRRHGDTGVEKFYYNHGAQWREGLQPDQSRRWGAEQNGEQRAGTAKS